ncbi:hypothetical protein [Exiguobacterium sp. s43]|uniref:hypothetical protein n=1 Tax=unclassified Exiguobacterium TaxID=2644629 RepID=UPI00333BADD1
MIEAETYTWKEIMETHDVSKDALRVWKVKFDTGGIDAWKESKTWKLYTKEQKLADRRGRTKQEEELTNEEKLESRIQQIERENERLRAENLFLKKLEEIERRG